MLLTFQVIALSKRMLKYIIILFLFAFVNGQNYTSIIVGADEYAQITLPIDISGIKFSVVSDSLISVYLLDYNNYISDYISKRFSNGDLLKDICKNVFSCDQEWTLDSDVDYILVIKNENMIEEEIIRYYIESFSVSGTMGWIITVGSLMVTFLILGIITIIIIISSRKQKNLK